MSMRLKGMLMNHLHAQLEQHLFADAVVLQDVPCEMTFQTAQGYMEFENEQHSYLPVFHLIGSVKEIRGDFPYNISSLYFSDEDVQYLTKDILYYPNPQELAHMITVGQFYTKRFRIPEILDAQQYSFPAKVNLTIIPPPNPAAYEIATYGGNFVAETDSEKLNLPIVYVQLAGTGVTRKTDKLLDYYGIDFEDGFEVYPLTAESSGYVDPPLMLYMESPELMTESEMPRENMSEMYITKEEEMQMIRDQREREKSENVVTPQFADEYQATPEDRIIAQAARNIEQRVANRVKENESEKESHLEQEVEQTLEHDAMLDFLEQTKDSQFIMMDDKSISAPVFSKDVAHDYSEEFITAESEESLSESVVESEEMIDFAAEEVLTDTESNDVLEDEVVSEVLQPDELEQHVDVKMNLGKEANAYVDSGKKEDVKESNDGLVDGDSDRVDMENLQGADVQDVSLQTKLDEARARELAVSAAVSVQDDIVEQDEKSEKNVSDDKSEHNDAKVEARVPSQNASTSKREVPVSMSEITAEYDASKTDVDVCEYQ